MSGVAVCTIVRGRRRQLRNLLVGLSRQRTPPDIVAIAVMGGPDLTGVADGLDLPVAWTDARSPTADLPLAAARNAARDAAGDAADLIFLDVDVIPAGDLVADYRTCLHTRGGVWSGHVDYLPPLSEDDLDDSRLSQIGRPHPTRPRPAHPGELSRPELFWSLSFALPAAAFDQLGGFDQAFVGYGGEDTDFALRADAAGIALLQTPDARGWHQHHASMSPPVNHLSDIVINARTFRRRWGHWPMEGWLTEFHEQGWVRWTPHDNLLVATAAGTRAQRDSHTLGTTPAGVG